MKRIALATTIIAGLITSNAHAIDVSHLSDDVRNTTAALIVLSESVCETELSPFMDEFKKEIVRDVDADEVKSTGLMIINSWKNKRAKDKWCTSAAKGLNLVETRFK